MEKKNDFIESFGLSRMGKRGAQRLIFKNVNKGSIKIQIQNRDNDANAYHWKDDGVNASSMLIQRWDTERLMTGLSLANGLYKTANTNQRRIKVAENKKNLLLISYKFNEEMKVGEVRIEIILKETQQIMKFMIKGEGMELLDDNNQTIRNIDNTSQTIDHLVQEIKYRHSINVSALNSHIVKCYEQDVTPNNHNSTSPMPF